MAELLSSIEKIATGGIELDLISDQKSQGFDWQKELEEVFKPLIYELKNLTERPRNIERLRTQIAFFEERLPNAINAVERLSRSAQSAQTPELQKELKRIEVRWRNRRDEIENKLKVATFELEQILAPESVKESDPLAALTEFFSGRGLSILLAIAAFSLTYYLLRIFHRVYERRVSSSVKRQKIFVARVVSLVFTVVSVFAALLATMIVLSIRGDWLLLGLMLIVLVAVALGLRHSIPRYVDEARILLNLGPVRENERVNYNGLP